MNCSLRKPRVPPASPHEGWGAGRRRGAISPNIRTALCGPAASGAGPDSRLPIFSLAANALFVLYIYIHPKSEPALSRAERKPWAEGRGQWGPALWSHPPSVPMPTAGDMGLVGVLMGGSCLGRTTPLCSVSLVPARPWPEFIHSFTQRRPKPRPTPRCQAAGEKAQKSQPALEEPTGQTDRKTMLSRGIRGMGGGGGGRE